MAKCKLCKKVITDEAEYCVDCADKKDIIANESYLDDLLNSVQNKATTASDIYKKKKEEHQSNDSPDDFVLAINDGLDFIDQDDLNDFELYDYMKEFDDQVIEGDEESYGDDHMSPEEDNEDSALEIVDEEDNEESALGFADEEDNEDSALEIVDEEDNEEPALGFADEEDNEEPALEIADEEDNEEAELEIADEEDQEDTMEHNIDNEFLNIHDDDRDITQDDLSEPVLEDLLENLDIADNSGSLTDNSSDDSADDISASTPEDELLELLSQFNPDSQVEDDIQAISELLGGISTDYQAENDSPEDVGEVFSEALEAISTLTDPDNGIQYISQEPTSTEDKKDVKNKKDKKAGLFTRLFANIEDEDLSPEERKAQEEAAAAKEAKKARKKKKKAKGKDQREDQGLSDDVNQESQQEEEKKAKKAKKAEKAEKKKKDKKEKKKIEILDDEIDEGRINKLGASIVLLFFGLIVILLLITTNIFSYTLSIKNARDYFGRQRYSQAYNEVYGIELKDEDIELYDKIMTVMFVNKQLNSYNNYYHMKKYPEALDSLLKGLQRYDKYIELATMLGIKTDLDYVRDQIVAELYNVFSLTEEEALDIINSDSLTKYSISVYNVILENISFYN